MDARAGGYKTATIMGHDTLASLQLDRALLAPVLHEGQHLT